MSTKWIDITQPLNNQIAHWPGDTPFSYEISYTKAETGSVNIGKMTTSLHTGTHVDSPFHFDDHGETIHQLDVEIFIGKALVIDVSSLDYISPQQLEAYRLDGTERVLLRTNKKSEPTLFPGKITPLDPALGPFLKERGIFLLGIDVPSVDVLDSKEMEVHHSFHKNNIHILENIVLDHVEPGLYEMIALPLLIEGADGSPVRAVIRPIEERG
ncbi:arylformamidase [Bacillus sp. REN10]|uniref:arylformamidase n=1 Tax=Bacillus sp. REN10 TaxID=2782541 RepID=UPI00193AE506|nr:arylformamidase [Bacillus sp. REN10]